MALDLKDSQPVLSEPVTAGGVKVATLGGGITPAICVGSGAPTLAAPIGSLYLRTDGSGVGDRLYVCSVAAGTWVAVTTAS